MGNFEAFDWEKLKKDVGMALEKNVIAVKKKAGELTEEGKRQYKIMVLKSKMHSQVADLGARVYSLMGSRSRNPALDATVKDIVVQIRQNEVKIATLTKRPSAASKK
jgi:hypothetical protein